MYKLNDETMCRICFIKQDTVFSLFRKRSGISPCEKLNKLGLKADVNDAGPTCICCNCLTELETTVNFLEKCERSNQMLAEHFSRGLEFTEEIVSYKDNLNIELENNTIYTENRVVEDTQNVNEECIVNEEVKASGTLCFEDARCEECGSRRRCRHWAPPQTHTCPYCQKVFNRKFNFKLHLKRHSGEREWSCGRCGASAVSPWLAARHCAPRPRRPCPVPGCGKTYTTITNLNTHLRVHSGDRPFKCTECQKTFTSKNTLNDHMRIHTGVLPYICPICGKRFRTNKLSAHMGTHTGARYACARAGCAKQFATRAALRRHAPHEPHGAAAHGAAPHEAALHGAAPHVAAPHGAAPHGAAPHGAAPHGAAPHACVLCAARYRHKQSLNKHVKKQHAQNTVPVQVEAPEMAKEIECDL